MAKLITSFVTEEDKKIIVGRIQEQIDELDNKKKVFHNFLKGAPVFDDMYENDTEVEVDSIIEFVSSHVSYVAHINTVQPQQLRAMYWDEESQCLRLSTTSMGGVYSGNVIADAVTNYNSNCLFGSEKIRRMYFRDGRRIEVF